MSTPLSPPDSTLESSVGREEGVPLIVVRWATWMVGIVALPFLVVLAVAISRFHSDLGADQLLTYYVIPVVVAWVLGVAMRARPALRINVAVLLVTLGVGVTIADVVLQIAANSRATDSGVGTGASISEGVRGLRRNGIDAYPTIPGNVIVDQRLSLNVNGIEVHPVQPAPRDVTAVLCDELAEIVVYSSDRYGFNNPDEIWNESEVDLVLIGDSYVHGLCVEDAQQLAVLLRRDRSVLNLGVRGAGPTQELATLREYGGLRRPDVVVWVYYEGNDRYDIGREANRRWLVDYVQDPTTFQGLAELSDLIDGPFRSWIDSVFVSADERSVTDEPAESPFLRFSDVLKLTTLRTTLGFGVVFPSRESRIGMLPQIVERARSEVESWGGALHLVYLPSYERYRTVLGEGVPGKREVLAAAAEHGVPVLDLDSVFAATGRPRSLWAHPRGHLSAEGYQIVASAIEDHLAAR